jgi:hypothetical protein
MRLFRVALSFTFLAAGVSCSSAAPPEAPVTPQAGRGKAPASSADSNAARSAEPTTGNQPPPPSGSLAHASESPFRRVLEASGGYVHEHQSRRLYSNEAITFELATGEVLIRCDYTRGYLQSGTNLYFAARMSPYSVCPDAPFLLEYTAKKWELRRFIDAHALLLDEWFQGTTIAAVVPYRGGPPFGYELLKVSGSAAPPRPKKGASDPEQPDTHCYTELQEPYSLHAFPSGALMVVGQSRCDLEVDPEGDEELSEEARAQRYRPVIESFPKASQHSALFSLPFDEVVWDLEAERDTVYLLGKNRSEAGEAPGKMVLVSFDGKTVREIGAELKGAQQLVLGPSAEGPKSAVTAVPAGEAASQVWIVSESALYPLGGGSALVLPPNCQANGAWFEGVHAWVACEDGVFTTDPEQRTLEIPKTEGFSTCEALDPRPESAIPGLYKKASSPGGCGGRSREFELGEIDPWSRPQAAPPAGDKKSGFY